MATQSTPEENMKALDNQVDALIAEIGGRKFTGDEAANLKNSLNDIRDKLGRVETIRVTKEDGSWKDSVVSEAGRMDEVPLFKFLVKKNIFKGGSK